MDGNKNTELRPYPTYQETGSTLHGKLPEHWEAIQLGRIGEFFKGAGGTKEDEVPTGLPCVRYGDLYTYHKYFINETRSFISPQKAIEYTPIMKGDILFTTSDVTIRNVGKSAVNLLNHPVYCGPDLIILRPTRPINPRFAGYLLDSPDAQAQKSQMQRGVTIIHIYTNQLKYLSFGLPPLAEQAAIARFLDHADEQIQRYIASKERLIALLEEERQALVHQAVTRGLDPNVPLKDSGVEWLGDVPEHWEVARFARQVNIAEGQVDPKIEPYASMLMIAPNHVESGTGRLLSRETASEQGSISGKYFCRAGDVVYSKIRPALAKVSVAPTDCLCSADMYPLRPRNSLQRDYLFWLLLSTGFTAWSVLQSDRVAMPKINRQTLNNVHIPLPPLSEQVSIVRHLIEATAKASGAIDRAHRQIDLMNEYRTRLIADVVTGQLDVREAAEELPTPKPTEITD